MLKMAIRFLIQLNLGLRHLFWKIILRIYGGLMGKNVKIFEGVKMALKNGWMIVSRSPIEDSEAAQFLYENSSCFFNKEEWFRVLREGLDVSVVAYCLEKDGRICLVLPGVIFNFGIVKMFYSNIPYGGFVGDFRLIAPSLVDFEKSIRGDAVHIIRIGRKFDTEIPDLDGYGQEIAFTHLIDLKGLNEEQLWKGYKSSVRRAIRKAEKSGVVIHEAANPEEIEALFGLYLETMRRNEAFHIWTKKMFNAVYRDLTQRGKAAILLAKLKDEIVAGIILLFSPETTYYFFAASAKKYLSLCPNDLLVHYGICLTIRRGIRYFDLMTSQKGDKALMDFKEKWGAQKHPFYFYEKSLTRARPWLWKSAWRLMRPSKFTRTVQC